MVSPYCRYLLQTLCIASAAAGVADAAMVVTAWLPTPAPALTRTIAPAGQASTPQTSGDWRGTVTTDGAVTTVVNQSGSMWSGSARLVEEARIGVETGADEYMFGRISGVAANAERIVVADRQAQAVRVYGHDGDFLGNVGRPGQGPGEFAAPEAVTIDDAGRIYVLDREHRVVVFEPDSSPRSTFRVDQVACCLWAMYPRAGGGVHVPLLETDQATRQRRYSVRSYEPDGTELAVVHHPEIEFDRVTYSVGEREMTLPFGPRESWGATPDGGLWTGTSDEYRFRVNRADGSVLAIEKSWQPVAYQAEERDWLRRVIVAAQRARQPDWDWDGAEIPEHKPAFARVVPVLSGGYWLVRDGAGIKRPDCTEDPLAAGITGERAAGSMVRCWAPERLIDAFDEEGRFLGSVEAPDRVGIGALTLHVDGDRVVTAIEDEAGIIRVVRYRLGPAG